jgi:hypothetical protein
MIIINFTKLRKWYIIPNFSWNGIQFVIYSRRMGSIAINQFNKTNNEINKGKL